MVREILVEWTTVAGTDARSVMHFDEATAVADQRAALQGWLADLEGGLHNSTSYRIATSGRELDTATGTLTGLWADPTDQSGTGTLATGVPVPDSVQILVQWRTGVVAGGRQVQGRTYIPGTSTTNVSGGNLAGAVRTSFATDSNAFAVATPSFVIWRRPVGGAGGLTAVVQSADCWTEFGSQRRRRH